ncbi:MAG TPA: DUF2911 domain-containing protein [Longimicrobiales bacterium]|nr:DUF2911 domain-containing protein [Longimicrobiales bacterium]
MKIKFVLLFGLTVGAAGAQAQQPADSGSFFVRLGRDTIAIERYTRTKQQLVSEAVLRTPVTRHLKLAVTFKDDGSVSWWEVLNNPVAGSGDKTPVSRVLATVVGDSVQIELWSGGQQRPTRKLPILPGMLPLQMPFYSTYETALQRARQTPADTTLSMVAGNAPLTYIIRFPRPDSITLYHPQGGLNVARLDKGGRMLRFNGEASTFKIVATRSRPVQLQPWLTRFAEADAKGRSIGLLSPTAKVENQIGGSNISIEYGRPSKRGRVIFGGIVPWDEVWRTGANAATRLTIANNDLMIGETRVPVGKYTLWTVPSRNGWQLIINKQTGQWGTQYDSAQDLARIAVKTESIPVPEEVFTVALQPKGDNTGTLTLTWDRTRVVVPLRVAP